MDSAQQIYATNQTTLSQTFRGSTNFRQWGRFKNAVYKTNPHTLEELKHNIRDGINNINRGELKHVWEIL